MSTVTRNRRRQTRHSVRSEEPASVEFEAAGGSAGPRRFTIVNLSPSGVSFALDPELSRLEAGTSIPQVTLRIGECAVHGELLVMHVTPGADSRYVCGSLFYPATDTDLVKLRSVIAGLEVAGTD